MARSHPWLAAGTVLRGWALARQGSWAEGVSQIREGIAGVRSTGGECHRPYHLALLAEALGAGGQTEDALAVLAEALAGVEENGERFYEAELHRLRGEFLLKQPAGGPGTLAGAEACFRQALAIARRQGARALEQRAATSLAHLPQAMLP